MRVTLKGKLTKVKLTVEFFVIDYIESVRPISSHIGDLEVEPLMVMI